MTEKSPEEWKRDSQSFDMVAEDYDAYRPSYPNEMVDCLIELTHLPPGGNILEVGPGTGKATRLFAERGYRIQCIEPGANLAAKAADNLKAFPQVQFEICRFEDWQETPGQYDVATSAQAWHWVPKETGYAKAARTLKPAGSIGLFWNLYPGMEGELKDELDRIYQEVTPGLLTPITPMEDTIRERGSAIEASGFFGPVTIRRFPWSVCYTTRQYQGLLNTYSDHLALPLGVRQRLYQAVGEAFERHGGCLDRPYVAVLFMAQKLNP